MGTIIMHEILLHYNTQIMIYVFCIEKYYLLYLYMQYKEIIN